MHARVNYRQIPPDKMDEAIRIYRDVVGPDRRAQQGFKGGYVLTNRSTGKLIAIALWETEADMMASVPPGNVDAITGEPPVRENYEVSIDDRPGSAGGKPTHARVNYRQIDADKMDEAIRIYRDSTIPEVKTRKGFAGGYILADRSTGKLIAMSLWETEADSIAAPPPGYVDAIAGGPAVRESYDISVEV